MTSERRLVGERIGIADVVFGLVIGTVSWFAMTSEVPAGWPRELVLIVAVPPAVLFSAMFAASFFIIRASVMFGGDVKPRAGQTDLGRWWQTFEKDE